MYSLRFLRDLQDVPVQDYLLSNSHVLDVAQQLVIEEAIFDIGEDLVEEVAVFPFFDAAVYLSKAQSRESTSVVLGILPLSLSMPKLSK